MSMVYASERKDPLEPDPPGEFVLDVPLIPLHLSVEIYRVPVDSSFGT